MQTRAANFKVWAAAFVGAPAAAVAAALVVFAAALGLLAMLTLFTEVRGRGILRSSLAGSCIDLPLRGARMASAVRYAACRSSTYCGAA
jgi:hypothetical protein